MVTKDMIEAQLKRLGVTVKGWGAGEINELQHILMDNETITGYAHGWYDNGFATLITTNERLLLIDKKLFHLTIEDVRYDMVAEVDFNARIMDATIRVSSMNKTLRFTSMKQRQLRDLTNYVQHRVMELRQQTFTWQQFEQTPINDQPVSLPLQVPELSPMRRFTQSNPYTKSALTTKHQFLPKVPRRFRPA
jgi:hypothetical protein